MIGEFLAEMKSRGSGYIINITSDCEREANAGMVVYTGTKFFWAGASEALRQVTPKQNNSKIIFQEGVERLRSESGQHSARLG